MIERINLQLFSESEKTEKPTPKKRREAREEGQILQSKEINTVVILFSCFLGLKFFGQYFYNLLIKLMADMFILIPNADTLLNPNDLINNSFKLITIFLIIVSPILAIAFISALVVNYFQVGFMFTTKTLQIKLNRLSPVEGFKRIFSKRAIMELFKSIFKITLVGYMAYKYIYNQMGGIIQYSTFEPYESFISFSNIIFGFILRILSILLLLAVIDYIFQWREHEKKLMMTKQEIKEEYKQTEGDPFIKGKIKERQRKMAMSRMMQEIPKADVIITNPTHYAVGIKYDRDSFEAPFVIAKGLDLIAENIKKIAKENDIPLVENRYLARALYDTVEINQMITEDLYEAVAEVLAYVYSLKEEL